MPNFNKFIHFGTIGNEEKFSDKILLLKFYFVLLKNNFKIGG
jgi:hypothetical protein